MVYAVVLIGSLVAICGLLLLRVVMQQRSIRRFVRSVRQRLQSAESRGALVSEEMPLPRPTKSPRASAIELQQVRILLRNAEKAIGLGKMDEAERVMIQALTIQPHAHDVRAELAKLYLTTSRESKAEAMYRELLVHHQDVSFYANLGLAYYRQGKYVEACQSYQEALNRDPKNPERTAALGRACIAARRYDEAAPLLEKATAFLSRNTELLHLLADCYLQLHKRDKAEETYRRIHKLEPYDEVVKQKLETIQENNALAA